VARNWGSSSTTRMRPSAITAFDLSVGRDASAPR
jgi:hypothetical protein